MICHPIRFVTPPSLLRGSLRPSYYMLAAGRAARAMRRVAHHRSAPARPIISRRQRISGDPGRPASEMGRAMNDGGHLIAHHRGDCDRAKLKLSLQAIFCLTESEPTPYTLCLRGEGACVRNWQRAGLRVLQQSLKLFEIPHLARGARPGVAAVGRSQS